MLGIQGGQNFYNRVSFNHSVGTHFERNTRQKEEETAMLQQHVQQLHNNRITSAGTYSLSQIRQKSVEQTQKLQNENIKKDNISPVPVDLTSKPGNSVVISVNQTTSQTAVSSSTANVEDIQLFDGTNTYSLGRNANIKISEGKVIVNNTDVYQFDENSTLRITRLMSPDANGIRQQNDFVSIDGGVTTINHSARFGRDSSLSFQIENGYLTGQSPVADSVLFGDADPVGTLKTHGGSEFMLMTNDQRSMIFSLQDQNGDYYIWEVGGDEEKISSAFNEIHTRAANESLSYDQLQEIAMSHGL